MFLWIRVELDRGLKLSMFSDFIELLSRMRQKDN